MQKTLKFIFFILLLIIIAEIIFLLIFFKPQEKTKKVTNTKLTTVNQQRNIPQFDNFYDYVYYFNNNPAIDPGVIGYLFAITDDYLKKAELDLEIEGYIVNINNNPNPNPFYPYFKPKLHIQFKLFNDNPNTFNFYLSEDDLKKTKFYVSKDGKMEEITANQLKINDKIIAKITIDPKLKIPAEEEYKKLGFRTKSWGFNTIKREIIVIK